jgi:hypothetical protein
LMNDGSTVEVTSHQYEKWKARKVKRKWSRKKKGKYLHIIGLHYGTSEVISCLRGDLSQYRDIIKSKPVAERAKKSQAAEGTRHNFILRPPLLRRIHRCFRGCRSQSGCSGEGNLLCFLQLNIKRMTEFETPRPPKTFALPPCHLATGHSLYDRLFKTKSIVIKWGYWK